MATIKILPEEFNTVVPSDILWRHFGQSRPLFRYREVQEVLGKLNYKSPKQKLLFQTLAFAIAGNSHVIRLERAAYYMANEKRSRDYSGLLILADAKQASWNSDMFPLSAAECAEYNASIGTWQHPKSIMGVLMAAEYGLPKTHSERELYRNIINSGGFDVRAVEEYARFERAYLAGHYIAGGGLTKEALDGVQERTPIEWKKAPSAFPGAWSGDDWDVSVSLPTIVADGDMDQIKQFPKGRAARLLSAVKQHPAWEQLPFVQHLIKSYQTIGLMRVEGNKRVALV